MPPGPGGSPWLTGKAEQGEGGEGGERIRHSGEGAVGQAQLAQAGGGQQRLECALLVCKRRGQWLGSLGNELEAAACLLAACNLFYKHSPAATYIPLPSSLSLTSLQQVGRRGAECQHLQL